MPNDKDVLSVLGTREQEYVQMEASMNNMSVGAILNQAVRIYQLYKMGHIAIVEKYSPGCGLPK